MWDVDGTLLDARGAGHRALDAAVRAVCGRTEADPLAGMDFAGRTDRALIEEALARAGRPDVPWTAVRDRYGHELAAALARTPAVALQGAAEALATLARDGRFIHVLGTGNLALGAWLKLRSAGLARWFATGGFGDAHRDRAPVLRDALRAARRHVPRPWTAAVAVGDTPRDREGARAAGLGAVLVATGRYGADALAAPGVPVLPSLGDPRRLADAIWEAAALRDEGGQSGPRI
ncbi:MAG: haloacid dehalogenase-like hydrolase [Actinomycetia bacterium]|nr:haloacid dehalogenase-like hydrolase [Actinomycetes bacterium]